MAASSSRSSSSLQRLLSASATLAEALPEVAAEVARLHEDIEALKSDKVEPADSVLLSPGCRAIGLQLQWPAVGLVGSNNFVSLSFRG